MTTTNWSTRSNSRLLFLSTLFESLFALLFAFFCCCSFRVSQLRVILETVEIVVHVAIEQRGVHCFSKRVNKHVVGGDPTNRVLEVLNSFTDIQQV